MAKRFTDTDKWKKEFLKSLPVEYKLFWLYLLDECDNAGIWHVEMDILELRLGTKLSIGKIRGFFKERIVEFDGGKKIFVPDFIRFQYGVPLNPSNNAHLSVIKTLDKYNLQGHISPLQGAQDMDMDMDKEKDKDKGSREFSNNWENAKNTFLCDEGWIIQFCTGKRLSKDRFDALAREFLTDLELKQEYKDVRGIRSHFTNWVNKKEKNGTHQQSSGGRNTKNAGRDELLASLKQELNL
jgi:hypothetical protein